MTDALAPCPMTPAEVADLVRRAKESRPGQVDVWVQVDGGRRVAMLEVQVRSGLVRYCFLDNGKRFTRPLADFEAAFRRLA